MECEFEEKQYEFPLDMELVEGQKVFIPGSVFEHSLGTDAALFTRNLRFWRPWFSWYSFWRLWRRGVYLRPEYWDAIRNELDSDRFPRFKFNLFLQYKRPEYISSHRGKEYRQWRQPYFRYAIKEDQQRRLYELEQRVSPNALVVYACAAFWRLTHLWEFQKHRRLVDNSNFVQPHVLQGHRRYTFANPGGSGIAFSEPVKVKELNLRQALGQMREREPVFRSNSEFLSKLSWQINEVLKVLPEELREVQRSMMEHVPDHQLARSIATISSFTYVTNITWGVGYKK